MEDLRIRFPVRVLSKMTLMSNYRRWAFEKFAVIWMGECGKNVFLGCALRSAAAVQSSRIYHRPDSDAGAWNRRRRGDFQRRQSNPFSHFPTQILTIGSTFQGTRLEVAFGTYRELAEGSDSFDAMAIFEP